MSKSYSECERLFILSKLEEVFRAPMPENSNPASYSLLATTIQKKLRTILPAVNADRYCTAVTNSSLRRFIYYRRLSCEQDLLDGIYYYFTGGYDRASYLEKEQIPDEKAFIEIEQNPGNMGMLFEFLNKYQYSEHLQSVVKILQDAFYKQSLGRTPVTKNLFYCLLIASSLLTSIFISAWFFLRKPAVYEWNLVTSWPDNSIYNGVLRKFARDLEDDIYRNTKINFKVNIHYNSYLPNGEPSTPGSLLDGLRGDSPKFELLHTTPYYYNNQYPRTNLYSAMPFGLFRSQIIRWLNEDFNKNGLKYIFAKDNDSTIITYPGGFTGAQYGGWFKYDSSKQFYDAMNSDNLYRNQKGRYPGLAGVVLNKKYGAEFPSRSAPSEIISDALEKGYSFFEFVGPSMDMQLGLHRVKGFNVYCLSSWHEPCTMLTLSVNNNRLQELFALNPQIESIFNGILQRYFLGQNTDEIYDKTTNDNGRALNEFHNQEIDTVHLSLPYLDSLRKDSDKYLNEWLTSTLDINKKVDASTKKLFESYMKLWNPTDYYINAFSHPDFK